MSNICFKNPELLFKMNIISDIIHFMQLMNTSHVVENTVTMKHFSDRNGRFSLY